MSSPAANRASYTPVAQTAARGRVEKFLIRMHISVNKICILGYAVESQKLINEYTSHNALWLLCSVIHRIFFVSFFLGDLQIISNDISELQKNQATTVAKIVQYKRKLMDLSHRVLQVCALL